MFWRGEPFLGMIVARREVGKDVVYAIVHLSVAGGDRLIPVVNEDNVPVVSLAVAREYRLYIESENAYNGGALKARMITLGRKRNSSPIEIVGIE